MGCSGWYDGRMACKKESRGGWDFEAFNAVQNIGGWLAEKPMGVIIDGVDRAIRSIEKVVPKSWIGETEAKKGGDVDDVWKNLRSPGI